jgi:hypothetical protein
MTLLNHLNLHLKSLLLCEDSKTLLKERLGVEIISLSFKEGRFNLRVKQTDLDEVGEYEIIVRRKSGTPSFF